MGTMRSVFTKSFIILPLLAFSWIQAFPSSLSKNLKDSKDRNEGETSFPPQHTSSSHTTVSPDFCYYISPGIPDCDFNDVSANVPSTNNRAETSNEINTNSIGDRGKRVKRMIVYQVIKCRPNRLPFVMPRCTKEDRIGDNVQVYKLVPFRPEQDMSEAPLIFPTYNSQHSDQPTGLQSQ